MKHEWKIGKGMKQTLPTRIVAQNPEMLLHLHGKKAPTSWKKEKKEHKKAEREVSPYAKYFDLEKKVK
jgi:hypothetical protein